MLSYLKGNKDGVNTASTSSNYNLNQNDAQPVQHERKKPPTPWVEKYRPKNVEDVVEQTEVVTVLQKCVINNDLPNMLLYGPPGTGKTSTILAAARQLFGDMYRERILELNASDERGINVVRTKIKNFAKLTAGGVRPDGRPCPPFRIIILDEADSMTRAAQSALRRTMEKESRCTRFCFICNYVSSIINPITSRCTKFRFKPLGIEQSIERLQLIATKENVQIEPEAIQSIVEISAGDMRRAITTLQSCFRLKGSTHLISSTDVLEMSGIVPEHYLKEYFEVCQSGDYGKLDNFVTTLCYDAYSLGQLLDQLNDYIIRSDFLTDMQKAIIGDRLGECAYRLQDGANEYLQIMDLSSVVMKALLQ